jgi:hypothetical protein
MSLIGARSSLPLMHSLGAVGTVLEGVTVARLSAAPDAAAVHVGGPNAREMACSQTAQRFRLRLRGRRCASCHGRKSPVRPRMAALPLSRPRQKPKPFLMQKVCGLSLCRYNSICDDSAARAMRQPRRGTATPPLRRISASTRKMSGTLILRFATGRYAVHAFRQCIDGKRADRPMLASQESIRVLQAIRLAEPRGRSDPSLVAEQAITGRAFEGPSGVGASPDSAS